MSSLLISKPDFVNVVPEPRIQKLLMKMICFDILLLETRIMEIDIGVGVGSV